MKLWYESEGRQWLDALPLGNGHMGAMCYGNGPGRYDLTEAGCWAGGPGDWPRDDGPRQAMDLGRRLLQEGRYGEGERVLLKTIPPKENYGTKLPLGRLYLGTEETPEALRRELDLNQGLAREVLTFPAGRFSRQAFLSWPHKVMGVRLEGRGLPLTLWLEGWSQPCLTDWDPENRELSVRGRAVEILHSDGKTGAGYHMLLRYDTDGQVSRSRRGLKITGATRVSLFLTAATDLFCGDPENCCRERLERAGQAGFSQVLEAHRQDHRAFMDRCSLTLPGGREDLPTDQRLKRFRENPASDPGLIALGFQYGRYLLLGASRPDSLLPAALQGIWSDDRACRMGWTDDIHLNINTQMNYFPAEPTGLPECTLPLLRWIRDVLMPQGKRIARELYGAEGWCAHTVSNAFGYAAPGWGLGWGLSPTCGAWISTHIWEHYLYTGDRDFLEEYYEVLYGSACFLRSLLTEDPETGSYVLTPSFSPENSFLVRGQRHFLCAGAAFDMTLVRSSLEILGKAAKALGRQDALIGEIPELCSRIPLLQVDSQGKIREWGRELTEADPAHRHTSHLLCIYPFRLEDPNRDPAVRRAVETTLERRYGPDWTDLGGCCWSCSLVMAYGAALGKGETCGNLAVRALSTLARDNLLMAHLAHSREYDDGIYEMDGNTGFTAGICEMLLQCREGQLRLLPGLPPAWDRGGITGLRAWGGHVLDLSWNPEKVSGTLTLGPCGRAELLLGEARRTLTGEPGSTLSFTFFRQIEPREAAE